MNDTKVYMDSIKPTYAVIRYFAMLGRRTAPNQVAVMPPTSMRHPLLQSLVCLPQNAYHYLDGCNYLQKVMLTGEQSALHVDFIFNDSLEDSRFESTLSDGLNVFLICTDNDEELIEMNISLSRVCGKNCVFWVEESKKSVFLMPKVVCSAKEFWEFLFDYAQPLLPMVEDPLCVPLCGGSVEFPYFKPANITFWTLNSALGNWGIEVNVNAEEEKAKIAEKAKEALGNMYGWSRQEQSVDIAEQLYGLCQDAFKTRPSEIPRFSDQNYPPLVIAAPYTTKDVRGLFKLMAKEKAELKDIDKVVGQEETPNYCFDTNIGAMDIGFENMNNFMKLFMANRLDFLDFAASLHCSFKFSPYLRLPLVSKSVSTELSFVGAKNNMQLAYSKDHQAYDKAIHKVGETLAKKLLSPKTVKMLETMPTQIVAMTDLPIEWMEIDGVPLGFSHDVCRLPETPVSGLLSHYGISRFYTMYQIPQDILERTLLVYGCREEAFKKWQDKADMRAAELGAKTVVCNSLNEFEAAVKKHKPDLLIIDTHGGTDLQNHQSYVYMGSEKVYPKDIAKRGIFARLVFISACNTAPCYNDVNTVGNAFLEVGASAVTASYLPLDVEDSSIIYLRIMQQLAIAAKQDLHKNWLAFIAHILRTSFIMSPMVETANEEKPIDHMITGNVCALSMIFQNRSKLYKKLKAGEDVMGLRYDFGKITPHYLMYTTVGRADLIAFEVSANKRREEYEKMKIEQ